MKALIAVLLSAVAVSGCVTTKLVGSAESIRVTSNAEVVRGCTYIGEAKGKDRMNGGLLGQDAAEENAHRRLKNQAAEMGGNVVHINQESSSAIGASIRGEVYSCSDR